MNPPFPLTSYPFAGVVDFGYQSDPNLNKLWDMGVRALIFKAGANTSVNGQSRYRTYHKLRATWLAKGGLWGNFFLPFLNTTAKSCYFQWLNVDEEPDTFRAIDWEPPTSGDAMARESVINGLSSKIEDKFGRTPLLYASPSTFENIISNQLLHSPKWHVRYTSGVCPTTFTPDRLPPGPGPVDFWQWSQDGDAIVKANDGIDFDVFNGTFEELQTYWKGKTIA